MTRLVRRSGAPSFLYEVRKPIAESPMMAIANEKPEPSDGKVWSLCRIPFWQSGGSGVGGGGSSSSSSSSSSTSSVGHHRQSHGQASQVDGSGGHHQSSGGGSVSSVARSFLPTRRRLRIDPANKLYFPCEFLAVVFLDFSFSCTRFDEVSER